MSDPATNILWDLRPDMGEAPPRYDTSALQNPLVRVTHFSMGWSFTEFSAGGMVEVTPFVLSVPEARKLVRAVLERSRHAIVAWRPLPNEHLQVAVLGLAALWAPTPAPGWWEGS